MPKAKSTLSPKDRARDQRLRREFQTTLEHYRKVLKFQQDKCAICRRPVEYFANSLALDHDHKTGLLRGLLCWGCNKIVGERAVAEWLIAAGNYLLNPPFSSVHGPTYTLPGRVGTKKRAKLLAALKLAKEKP